MSGRVPKYERKQCSRNYFCKCGRFRDTRNNGSSLYGKCAVRRRLPPDRFRPFQNGECRHDKGRNNYKQQLSVRHFRLRGISHARARDFIFCRRLIMTRQTITIRAVSVLLKTYRISLRVQMRNMFLSATARRCPISILRMFLRFMRSTMPT